MACLGGLPCCPSRPPRYPELVIIPGEGPAPITGVIFDFHATLVDARDPGGWVRAACRRLGRPLNGSTASGAAQLEGLCEHLDRIWEHASTIDPNSERDLSQACHREVFSRAVGIRSDV